MTLHILEDLEQGSEAWHDARRGIVTASTVGRLLTTSSKTAIDFTCPECLAFDGNPCVALRSKTKTPIKTMHAGRAEVARNDDSPPTLQVADNDESRGLTLLLVAERVAGWTDPTFMSNDMWRGREHEPIARDHYSGHYQQAVECGFMRRDEDGWTLGYSPDGLVADDGLVEIKAPRAKTHLNTILADEVPPYYMPQLQAGLLVSGRAWIDFVSFCGGMPLYVKRVLPDARWFEAIEAAVRKFETTAAEMVAAYETKTKGLLPPTERVPDDLGLVF